MGLEGGLGSGQWQETSFIFSVYVYLPLHHKRESNETRRTLCEPSRENVNYGLWKCELWLRKREPMSRNVNPGDKKVNLCFQRHVLSRVHCFEVRVYLFRFTVFCKL